MTFNPAPYDAVVINEFTLTNPPVFDDAGTFLTQFYFKANNISKWAGHVAHAFMIEVAYDDLHVDGSPTGNYVDGLEQSIIRARIYFYDPDLTLDSFNLFNINTTSLATPTATFEPAPMVYDVSMRYGADAEFPAGANNYRFMVVLVTPTVMPSVFVVNNTTPPVSFEYDQRVPAGYGIQPSLINGYPDYSKYALRITAYVERTEIPPLRLISRDDNLGKRPTPRISTVNTRNNGYSLQAQQGLRVSNTANVWW